MAGSPAPAAPGAAPVDGGRALERRLGLALTLLAWALYPLCLWRGWGAWNDVLVDFGRELYVPWRLVEGDVLRRDVAYFNGPLSPYWNALWFLLLGPSLRTLTVVNAVLAALVGHLLHRRVRSAGGPVAAGATLLLFFPLFACGHFPGIGNYNFLAPYSHELTHGVLLGLLALEVGLGAVAAPGRARALATGVLLGLVLLTKAEVSLAFGATIAFLWIARGAWRGDPARSALLVAGALLPAALSTALLSLALTPGEALRATLGTWVALLSSDAASGAYYATYMGTDRLGENLAGIARNLGWLALLFGPAALLDRLLRGRGAGARGGAAALSGGFVLGAFATRDWGPFEWMLSAHALPVVALLGLLGALLAARRAEGAGRARWIERAALALLAGLMMLKILFAPLLCHYGFALSLLGAALLVTVVAGWLPALVTGDRGRGLALQAAAVAWVAATAWGFWSMSEEVFAQKTVVVGAGADAFRAEPVRGEGTRQLLEQVEARLKPEHRLLVMPEGVMVNYLARRRTPTRHVNFMPPELSIFGEEAILAELRAATPPAAAVALVHKDTSEYGPEPARPNSYLFGAQYGTRLARWVQRRYQVDWTWGDPPLTPRTRFGVAFLGHR